MIAKFAEPIMEASIEISLTVAEAAALRKFIGNVSIDRCQKEFKLTKDEAYLAVGLYDAIDNCFYNIRKSITE